MRSDSFHDRCFTLRLSYEYEDTYTTHLYLLQQFLTRLGRETTLALWREAFAGYDDTELVRILSSGWQEAETPATGSEEEGDGNEEDYITEVLARIFPTPIDGFSQDDARAVVDGTPPFRQIRRCLPSLDLEREITTYDALHLSRDSLATLAETVIERHGKEGELMVYDALLGEVAGSGIPQVTVADFMERRRERFAAQPEEPDMHSAGLEVELVSHTATEVVTRVTACEWARYYRDRHPKVGYMLACSRDNPIYRAFNSRIRLQRTCTLMHGDGECDFRVYALGEALAAGNEGERVA